ncbi:hypothetical protein [Blastococcus brunescens]|uniref:Uncharacterized protein n=1 Tax=Blastococcus brunescens TaxID=1564165 RepID=A0ABZ1ATX8_9ACTN|nr:hypothetical protein [Blastococcus sp. BMG 8361]WRL62036.1 hypothetical protein U6N30_18420 [Blastococcus sp. BMG 8361]
MPPPADDQSDRGAGDGIRAADVFVADLRSRPGGWLLQGVRLPGAALSELFTGLFPSPSVHDVVVTRRDDGTEVLREPAGEPLHAGELLAQVRDELERLDPATFLESWSAWRAGRRARRRPEHHPPRVLPGSRGSRSH